MKRNLTRFLPKFETNSRKCFSSSSKISHKNIEFEEFDVTIVGLGIVGSTFATILGSSPLGKRLKILILDKNRPTSCSMVTAHEEPGIRVSALTLHSKQIFEQLGLWDKMKKLRMSPYSKMEIWDAFSRGRVSFDVSEMRNDKFDSLGYVVENDVIQSVLFEKLQNLSKDSNHCLQLDTNANITSMTKKNYNEIPSNNKFNSENESDLVTIKLDNSRKIRTRLLIGADGAMSSVKRAFEFPTLGWNYNQKAVVAIVQHNNQNKTAFQRFLPNGPVAFLPCYNNYGSIVWATNPKHANHLVTCSDKQFIDDLNSAFRASPEQFSSDGLSP